MSVDAIQNDRTLFIRNNLAKGKSREEIAVLLGYKTWRSLDIFMRRTGAKWDSGLNTYVFRQENIKKSKSIDIERIITDAEPKVAMIITKFKTKTADPIEIAKECGFCNHRALSSYMKSKGYQWSDEVCNYIDKPLTFIHTNKEEAGSQKETPEINSTYEENNLKKYLPLLELLYKNKEKFIDFVTPTSSNGTMPRYTVPGITRTKSFYMSDKLSRLISEFSETRNVSQKEIIEAAIIEFLRNHSFKDEVDSLLGRL